MTRGGYATPPDVVVAALTPLDQHKRFGDFEPGELNRLLAEGEAGDFLDGGQALADRRRRRESVNAGSAPRSA